jgi:two-component system, LytTR family, sensor kinase
MRSLRRETGVPYARKTAEGRRRLTQNEMDPHPEWRLGRREIVLIIAFWTFLAVLSAANRLVDPRGPGVHIVPPSVPIVLTLFESVLWAALTPLVFRLAAGFSLSRSNWIWRVPVLVAVGLVLALAVHSAIVLLRMELLEGLPRRTDGGLLRGILRLWFLNDFILYLGVLAAGFAREYFRRYQTGHREALRLTAEAAGLQGQLAEARLAALRTQLNPHFLFNTLHAISALVGRDPAGVRRMIARLSELLRSTLEDDRPQRTVEREVAFIARYLEIMQVRFEGKLAVETVIEPAARDALVPTLILQPLVENAVGHGVAKVRGAGRVEVTARRLGDRVQLTVRDNGPGWPDGGPPVAARGIGLRNTEARLRQTYGDAQRFVLENAEDGGARAVVEVPYRAADPAEPGLPPAAEAAHDG